MASSPADRGGRPPSLLILDVDLFQSYNDDYRRRAGDDVLRALADILDLGTSVAEARPRLPAGQI